MNKIKMTNAEATEILNNIWDYATANDDETADTLETAIDTANIALDALEKIKAIVNEAESFTVSANNPNQVDYYPNTADKFRRIWKAIFEAERKTFSEAKNKKHTRFECYISEGYDNTSYCDEWGVATLWINDNQGVEYNLCIDGELNSSAIYKMEYNERCEEWTTDYSIFEHYEVDFSNANWKNELKKAMYEAAKKFFG